MQRECYQWLQRSLRSGDLNGAKNEKQGKLPTGSWHPAYFRKANRPKEHILDSVRPLQWIPHYDRFHLLSWNSVGDDSPRTNANPASGSTYTRRDPEVREMASRLARHLFGLV